MKKKYDDNIVDMLNKFRGYTRERYIRPRSVVFKDKTKYDRKVCKRVEME